MKKGMFITFEGGEGSGKSTQIKLLAQKLREQGIKAVLTREPGGTPAGEAIRQILVTGDADKISAPTEALLNYAARAEHLKTVIRPAIISGKWVISDRFNDSTFAYQGGNVAIDFLKNLDDKIVAGDQPDLTFLLDIDPELGLQRAGKRIEETIDTLDETEDRFEKKGLIYHRAIRDRFLERAKNDKKRYVIIDASLPENEVEKMIWDKIKSL